MRLTLAFECTTHLRHHQERLAQIKAQGLSCVHLALSKVFPEMEIIPQKLTPGFASCLKKEFVKADVDIAVLGCYLNLLNPDAQQLAQIKNTYKAHIRFAAASGAVWSPQKPAPQTKIIPPMRAHAMQIRSALYSAVKRDRRLRRKNGRDCGDRTRCNS